MNTQSVIKQLGKIKGELPPSLEYLANSLIQEYDDFQHLSEFSLETAIYLIGRVK